jgi:ribose transport system permease protein
VNRTAEATETAEAPSFWKRIPDLRVEAFTTWGLLVAAVVINAILQDSFFSEYSITSIFATFVPLVLVGVAQAIVIIGGGLDLSLGSIVAFSSVVTIKLMQGADGRVWLGFLVALGTGLACGVINGLIVSLVRLQSLVTTLATSTIFAGAALFVLPKPGGTVPQVMTRTYRDTFIAIPVSVWCVIAVAVAWIVLRRTRVIRHIYAVGGDPDASYASLVPVTRIRTVTFTIAGGFAGLAGFAVLANSGSGDPLIGGEIALDSIAAAVVGGIALRGGRGGAIGAIAGAIILSLVSNIVFFFGVPTTYRQLANGLVVIGALALSALSSRSRGHA